MKIKRILLIFLLITLFFSGCGPTYVIKKSFSPELVKTQPENVKYLKVHMRNGDLFVLDKWRINTSEDTISGAGRYYNQDRNKFVEKKYQNSSGYPESGWYRMFNIPTNDIVLIETNQIKNSFGHLGAILLVGIPMGILTIYCIANPKSCFGSCPTFYGRKDGQWALMAEGFSSSIFPSFEKKDIDMLYNAEEDGDTLSLKLTNEALETHVIRYVDLLIFPETEGEKVYATEEGIFYRASEPIPPTACQAAEGDCLNAVKTLDSKQRYSETDPGNLSQKEEIFVSFDNISFSEPALVIGSKQTLLTTYLFYQGMAFSGNNYGHLVAKLENGSSYLKNRIQKLWDKLGGIEIFLCDGKNEWKKIDEIKEMGPIAEDVHLVRLPSNVSGKVSLKIRMTKGLWRVDYLSMVNIIGEESPMRIEPALVLKDNIRDDGTFEKLTQHTDPLVTLPGDNYILEYKLPTDCRYQFFMETQGYYLEWMREEWLAEENMKKLAFEFVFPGLYLRKAAPEFKKVEPTMEKSFWGSRYVVQ